MRISELLQEARRNPEQNIKVSAYSRATAFATKGRKYVSYINVPKIGINPSSSWSTTPLAVYGYPLSYVLDYIRGQTLYNQDLFAADSRYVAFFDVTGNVVDVGRGKKLLTRAEAGALSRYTSSNIRMFGGDITTIEGLIYDTSKTAYQVVKDLTELSIGRNNQNVMTSLMRVMGWDAIIDDGTGTIHSNEPYQIAVINPKSIKNVEIYVNERERRNKTDHARIMSDIKDSIDRVWNAYNGKHEQAMRNRGYIMEVFEDIIRNYKKIKNILGEYEFRNVAGKHLFVTYNKIADIVAISWDEPEEGSRMKSPSASAREIRIMAKSTDVNIGRYL